MKKKIIISVVVILALAKLIHHTSLFRIVENFHEVDPGKFYRSAQLDEDEFDYYIKKYGIKTIINLRGTGNDWYKGEEAMAKKHGVALHNLHSFHTEYVPPKRALCSTWIYSKPLKDQF